MEVFIDVLRTGPVSSQEREYFSRSIGGVPPLRLSNSKKAQAK